MFIFNLNNFPCNRVFNHLSHQRCTCWSHVNRSFVLLSLRNNRNLFDISILHLGIHWILYFVCSIQWIVIRILFTKSASHFYWKYSVEFYFSLECDQQNKNTLVVNLFYQSSAVIFNDLKFVLCMTCKSFEKYDKNSMPKSIATNFAVITHTFLRDLHRRHSTQFIK